MLDPNFVLDDEGRDRLIARFGAGVEAWCAALPDLVERYCLRWHLELDNVLAGNTSRVFIGRQHGDRGVVLKLTPDLTFDAIDWTLDQATSIDEVRERIGQLCRFVPDLDRDRLWHWCQATAAALAILRLRHRPHDGTTQLLLKLAAST
jgi:hypothetical protein